ncbi:MAG TPA: glycosyltransferase family 4 protein [Syntrophorhabdaceae bacterium]|nr:glycosyltransferase family 4 protein [Syntrophorhabdaceae bacterium]
MKKKLCFIATLELPVKVFLAGHMRFMQGHFDLSVIVRTEDPAFLEPFGITATVIPVDIRRDISIREDLRSLRELFRIFRNERFGIVHSIMPKSGLLSMVAGFFARVPVRVHTFTGQLWKNYTGLKRFFFKCIDRLIAACATHILVDSPSQRDFLIREGVVGRKKSSVLGYGSICGVDTERFRFDERSRNEIRERHGIDLNDIAFLYLGRLKRDKGILDLAHAFTVLCGKFSNVHLFIVGPDEEKMMDEVISICDKCADRIYIHGFTETPEKYMSAADVLCLPSYREGFGQVIAEAAAVGIPSIGSNIYGITDTIDDGVNGYLFEAGAHYDLMQKMTKFVEDPSTIKTMGVKARLNVFQKFTKEKVTSAMAGYYEELERSL